MLLYVTPVNPVDHQARLGWNPIFGLLVPCLGQYGVSVDLCRKSNTTRDQSDLIKKKEGMLLIPALKKQR